MGVGVGVGSGADSIGGAAETGSDKKGKIVTSPKLKSSSKSKIDSIIA